MIFSRAVGNTLRRARCLCARINDYSEVEPAGRRGQVVGGALFHVKLDPSRRYGIDNSGTALSTAIDLIETHKLNRRSK